MNIGLVQFDPVWEDKHASMQKINEMLRATDLSTVDLLVFPEMTLTGFTMRSRSFAEEQFGETFDFFANQAKTSGTDIVYGNIEAERDKYFNTLVHIDAEGSAAGKYRKIHPFSFTGEDRFYNSGSEPVITEIDGVVFGLSICYDLRFPELFRYYGKKRVAGIINIANWPVQRIDHWSSLLKARAIENLCFVISVNRTGSDKSNKYNGVSTIISPGGKRVIEMSDEQKLRIANINLAEVETTQKEFPFLDDIRLI